MKAMGGGASGRAAKRRKGADEPTYSFTARVIMRSADAFIAWCEREG
jgi:hypothetical protein